MELGMAIGTRERAAPLRLGALATFTSGVLVGMLAVALMAGPHSGAQWAAAPAANLAALSDVDVVMSAFEVWGSGGFMGEAARENAEKYYTKDTVLDASALIDAPLYKVYHGIDGFLEFINTLAQIKFVDFVPQVFVTPTGTVLAKNTYSKGTLLATGASVSHQTDYLEFTLSGGKISYVKFYWGDQPSFEKLWESESVGVVAEIVKVWGKGGFSGPDKEKFAAEFFTDDALIDATANIKGTDGYKLYHGPAGALQWTDYLAETYDFPEFVPKLYPGPEFGRVAAIQHYRCISKKSGKSGTFTDWVDYEITGGKVSYIKFYWGDTKLLQEIV